MVPGAITVSIFCAAAIVFLAAAAADLRSREIPNAIVIAVLFLAAIRILVTFRALDAGWDILGALAVFVPLLVAWHVGWIGGGDLKLIGSAALLVGHQNVLAFVELTVFCGGIVALVQMLSFLPGLLIPGRARIDRRLVGGIASTAVPYGVAIAVGCLTTMYLSSFGGT